MNTQNRDKNKEVRITMYFYLVLILFLLLTVASYTWFSLTTTPRISDLSMFVASTSGMELALEPDAEEWGLTLDFSDMVSESAPLRPITWSNQRQQFVTGIYGFDGRLTGQELLLTDELNANRDDLNGYYIMGTFYARTGTAGTASLTPAIEVDKGIDGAGTYVIGTPVWNVDKIEHDNGGKGAENAVRMAFRITYVNSDGTAVEGREPLFYIYEPNCDTHLDGYDGYLDTPSIDGTDTLVPMEQMILQTASTWYEAYPVQRSVVIKRMGEFTTSTELFSLLPGEMVKIQLYIWLEGQDVDCNNQIQAAQIFANVQFDFDAEGGSGLVPIG